MRYLALAVIIIINVAGLITFFQNLLQTSSDFSILFWTFRTTASGPLFVGFIGGIITTVMTFVFFHAKNIEGWEGEDE